jgi:hypothetical protein
MCVCMCEYLTGYLIEYRKKFVRARYKIHSLVKTSSRHI